MSAPLVTPKGIAEIMTVIKQIKQKKNDTHHL